jgi:hypothetical protein
MSVYSPVFKKRLHSGEITAEEIMAGRAFVHMSKQGIDLATEEEVYERIALAVKSELFYLLFFLTYGPHSMYFSRMLMEIENKYFDPKIRGANRPNADFTIVGFGQPIIYYLMKKTRINKRQMFDIILRGYSNETKKEAYMEMAVKDKGEKQDIIPLVSGTPEEEQMIRYVYTIIPDLIAKVKL